MSYSFPLKRGKHRTVPREIELAMDQLINNPFIILPDSKFGTELGKYTKELRNKKLLHISTDIKLGEPIAVLKINNALKPNSVLKCKGGNGRTIEYIFNDTLIPKFNLDLSTDDII